MFFGGIKMIKFILLLLILIFIMPIPIKINVLVHNSKIEVYLYKFNIYPLRKKLKVKAKHKAKETAGASKIKSKFNLNTFKSLIHSLDKNPIKPTFKIKLSIDYSLEDAAYTAQIYSTLWQAIMIPINILNIPLKVKIENIELTPKFSNRYNINISLTGIIYINLAKLLFVLFLVLKSLFWHKEVKPLRGNYGI